MTDPGEFAKGKKGSRVVKRHLNRSEMLPPFGFLETETNSVTHGARLGCAARWGASGPSSCAVLEPR